MKDKYNELFKGELGVKKDGKDIAVIGDKEYWLFEIDDNLTCEDGKHLQRANYIANAVNNFADMYAEIKQDIECLTRWIDNHGDAFPMTAAWKDMRANKIELLKRARGE